MIDENATPRTDALLDIINKRRTLRGFTMSEDRRALIDHARQLEREVAAAQEEVAELEVKRQAEREKEWNGKDRRCEHEMRWISDWYGDSGVINGTADCSRSECELCDWVDPNGERDDYYDEP
jgi:hypothetical protein